MYFCVDEGILNFIDYYILVKICYSCVESSFSDCGMNMFNCFNDIFFNIGLDGGDCYIFVGWYWSNNMWMLVVMCGCVNCLGNYESKVIFF